MSLLEKCYLWFYPKAYGWLKRFHVPGLSYTDRIEHSIVLTYIEKNFKDVIKKYPPYRRLFAVQSTVNHLFT